MEVDKPMITEGEQITTPTPPPPDNPQKVKLWSGALEWFGFSQDNDAKNDLLGLGGHSSISPTASIPCTFYSEGGVEEGVSWGSSIGLHLLPRSQLTLLDLSHLQATRALSVSLGAAPHRPVLTKLLRTGRYVGCVHISPLQSSFNSLGSRELTTEMGVVILLYSRGKQAVIGFIPEDPPQFIAKLLQLIPNHSLPQARNVQNVEISSQTNVQTDDKVSTVEMYQSNVETGENEEEEEESMEVTPPAYWNHEIREDFRLVAVSKLSSQRKQKKLKFYKGCKWAPDGSCLLTNSDDDTLRLFNLPSSLTTPNDDDDNDDNGDIEEMDSVLDIPEGGQVYDYAWYPKMSSYDPPSCCFLTTTSDAPVHLWDAFTGRLRASYLAYNQVDQVVAAHSLAFDPSGEKIFCGFDSCVRTFDLTRPGRACIERKLKGQPMSQLNQPGIVSSLAVNPSLRDVLAVGSYLKTIGLYHADGSVLCILQGHLGGLTHITFSPDGTKLFSGGRKDGRLICWDMRFMGDEYKIFDRVVATNQRIYFDLTPSAKYLLSGGTDGKVRIWDLSQNTQEYSTISANQDCVNGISVNPFLPILATSSGQRHLQPLTLDSSSSSDSEEEEPLMPLVEEGDVKLWKFC